MPAIQKENQSQYLSNAFDFHAGNQDIQIRYVSNKDTDQYIDFLVWNAYENR